MAMMFFASMSQSSARRRDEPVASRASRAAVASTRAHAAVASAPCAHPRARAARTVEEEVDDELRLAHEDAQRLYGEHLLLA